jgi:hypothetical protein
VPDASESDAAIVAAEYSQFKELRVWPYKRLDNRQTPLRLREAWRKTMALAVLLTLNQLEAADRLHRRFKQWQLSDDALHKLRAVLPDWGLESCLLKCIAVNALYGTQVYAVIRMAHHVTSVLSRIENMKPTDLVERIAALPKLDDEKKSRQFISFAAKLCHFFIDSELYPIYDEAARNVLKLHLGKDKYVDDVKKPFAAFCKNIEQVRREAGIRGKSRELDRYLWLTGMYMKWVKGQPVNTELKSMFMLRATDDAIDVSELLPAPLKHAYLGFS